MATRAVRAGTNFSVAVSMVIGLFLNLWPKNLPAGAPPAPGKARGERLFRRAAEQDRGQPAMAVRSDYN
jgi:hypothetical protein